MEFVDNFILAIEEFFLRFDAKFTKISPGNNMTLALKFNKCPKYSMLYKKALWMLQL